MEEFHHYTNNMGGLENFGPFISEIDKRNNRILMEEQYNFVQFQKSEILAQQKYREEQIAEAKLSKRFLIFNTIITTLTLIISIISIFK